MEDVARRAGVSTATVSRSLKDDPAVTAETRRRVQEAAAEIGYILHRQGRALRSKRSGTVAVNVPYAMPGQNGYQRNPFLLEFLAAVGGALHNAQIDMLVSRAASVDPSLHRSGLVDGYIQLGHALDDSILVQVSAAGIPLAVWSPPMDDRGYCAVGVDNVDLARQATAHLIARGRRRIALISGDLDDARSEGRHRWQGYLAALEDAGIAFDESIVASADTRPTSGIRAIRQILEADRSIDAVFVAYGDVVAMTVQRELADRGLSVPDTVAVVGFDNIQMAEYAYPRLTTVDQGLTAGVGVLVDKLIRQIEGKSAPSEFVEGRLVIRESCGARQ